MKHAPCAESLRRISEAIIAAWRRARFTRELNCELEMEREASESSVIRSQKVLNSWKVGVPNGPPNQSNTVVAVVYPTWGRYTYFSAKTKAAGHTKGLCVRLLASALIVWMEVFEIFILIMFREWEKIIRVVQL